MGGFPGKEIFARIGRGIYVKAKIISEELSVNIGENNFVNKSIKDTKNLIEKQVAKLKELEGDLKTSIDFTNREFMEMIQEYQGNNSEK